MNKNEFISILQNEATITDDMVAQLKEMTQHYPYFAHPHILLAQKFKQSNDINTAVYIQKAAVYSSDKKTLYFKLNPDKASLEKPQRVERSNNANGNYFDMLQKVEAGGGDTKLSLKTLADKLKAAREAIQIGKIPEVTTIIPEKNSGETKVRKVEIPTPDYFSANEYNASADTSESEEEVKLLIKNRKYEQALRLLKELYLINPKKSIYFADQIRFLEKILDNTKITT